MNEWLSITLNLNWSVNWIKYTEWETREEPQGENKVFEINGRSVGRGAAHRYGDIVLNIFGKEGNFWEVDIILGSLTFPFGLGLSLDSVESEIFAQNFKKLRTIFIIGSWINGFLNDRSIIDRISTPKSRKLLIWSTFETTWSNSIINRSLLSAELNYFRLNRTET